MNISLPTRNTLGTFAFAVLCLFAAQAASAAGLDGAKNGLDYLISGLMLLSGGVVTLAILFLGWKILFGRIQLEQIFHVVIGAALIAGASGIAAWLLQTMGS